MNKREAAVSERVNNILKKNPVFLDTETTGLGSRAQIVEIAVLDMNGNALLDTLVRATCPIEVDAARVHGILPDHLVDAPTFDHVVNRLQEIINGRTCVIYNAGFDTRLLIQSALANGVQRVWENVKFECAMLLYAEFWGDVHPYYGDYQWQSLGSAASQQGIELPTDLHRARADAELTRRLMLKMSEAHNGQV